MTARTSRRWAFSLCAAAVLAASSCTRVVTGSPVLRIGAPAPSGNACASVTAPMTAIESHTPGEPRMSIPQPPGWQRTAMLDSAVIRFTMGNKGLSARNFMPTAVVTLESVTGANADPHAIFDQERAALVERLGASGLRIAETTLCGMKAETVDYDAPAMGEIPPRRVRTLMAAGPFAANSYVATVTVQSTDPTNPDYSRDTDTILTGFQMLPPDGG